MQAIIILICVIQMAYVQATDKLQIFTPECYKIFFEDYHFLHADCIAKTVSKITSLGIVSLSVLYKAPQIIKIIKKRSVEGISLSSLFIGLILNTFNIAYNIHNRREFMLYGEQIIIVFQSMIVIFLYKYFSRDIKNSQWITLFLLYSILTSVLLFDMVPEILFVFSIYVNIMLSKSIIQFPYLVFCSLVPQIFLNFRNKSTGQLAFITQMFAFTGAIARGFTIFVSISDVLYQVKIIIILQISVKQWNLSS